MAKLNALGCVSAAALMVASVDVAAAAEAPTGTYLSGDFHNHTVCSDGSTSVETLTKKSLEYLDWFIQADHSGDGNRDCAFDDPSSGLATSVTTWSQTIGNAAIKGLQANGQPKSATGFMWRWQALEEFEYPQTTGAASEYNADHGTHKPAFQGVEWVVPGHEHSSVSVITDQFPLAGGNAAGLAQFEYCFAASSDDTSGGAGQGWTCSISAANNQRLINRFTADPVNQGPADYNASLNPATQININDTGDHVKSTAGVFWLKENHLGKSYAVQAHLERAGAFRPGANNGYNIEHLRDWNSAAPSIAFGFESQPGHQAASNRGEYAAARSSTVASAGLFTYGGTGCYAAAEASQPGFDFDGVALTADDFKATGRFPEVADSAPPSSVTLCRPGVRTVWDALLSEGRRFWFFANSDWHNRGTFTFNERQSAQDFYPGEYQRTHVYVVSRHVDDPAQDIVDGMRSGNLYATMGDLITDLDYQVCSGDVCANMGETLTIASGADITVRVRAHDPAGPNNSPYTFNNPALVQVGINEPLNTPTLRHVDLIIGRVREPANPTSKQYRNQLAPSSTRIEAKYTADGPRKWTTDGEWIVINHVKKNITASGYVRLRGSNMPAGTPNERDADGNPLRDDLANNIACSDPACPAHVNGIFDKDVEGWGDLWFYSNPVFINVIGATASAGDAS